MVRSPCGAGWRFKPLPLRSPREPAYPRMLEEFDQPERYLSSAAYTQYAIDQTAREKVFLDPFDIKS